MSSKKEREENFFQLFRQFLWLHRSKTAAEKNPTVDVSNLNQNGGTSEVKIVRNLKYDSKTVGIETAEKVRKYRR